MQVPKLDYSALSKQPADFRLAHVPNPRLLLICGITVVGLVSGLALSFTSTQLFNSLFAIFALLVIFAIVYGVYKVLDFQKKQRAAIDAFARMNGLTFQLDRKDPPYAGMMFNAGSERKLLQSLTIPTDKDPIEIGNYQYVTGSGKSRSTHRIGFMRLKLPRRVPNMMLDAKANNFYSLFSNLPTFLNKDQVLQLEGNFNNYFTLYAPKQYERDALYVFTPDVMQALIDYAGDYDVEVIDNDLFIYATKNFNLADPARIQNLLMLASKLSPEFETQTHRYADERVGNRTYDIIAEPGQRLKKGVSWAAIALVASYVMLSSLPDITRAFAPSFSGLANILIVVVFWGGVLVFALTRRKH